MQLAIVSVEGARGVYDEASDLRALRKRPITRASHGEPDLDGNWRLRWGRQVGRCWGRSGREGRRWRAERGWLVVRA